jgi:hypothetical protein
VTLKLLHLPWEWMKEAATDPRLTPMEAARLAMFAIALEIMLVLPLRRRNVVKLRLDTNLRRPGPQALISEIFVPRRAVKNRHPITWPIEAETARLIEAYLKKYRPLLEVAAHILGHKNPETTRRFYCGLELDAAARHANALLTGKRKATKILALGAYHKPHRQRRAKGAAP